MQRQWVLKLKNKAASHWLPCKGFQNKRTDISRVLKVYKTRYWALIRDILCFRPIFKRYNNCIIPLTALAFRSRLLLHFYTMSTMVLVPLLYLYGIVIHSVTQYSQLISFFSFSGWIISCQINSCAFDKPIT